LSVYYQGRGPWSFTLTDGTSTTTYDNISTDNYAINVKPVSTATYRITTVEDVNGVINTGSGDVNVKVNEKTYVEFLNIATGYSVEEDPVQLLTNIPGGIFSGPGVVSPNGIFDPAIADTVDSPHTIIYAYTNEQGCVSEAEALVFVLGAMGGVFIPEEFVCSNGDPFTVSASNIALENGSFRLLNSTGQAVAGITDFGNNSAEVNPGILVAGTYSIEYRYFDGVEHIIHKEFVVESVSVPVIQNLTDDSYCQNITPFILEANSEDATFEGPGVFYSPIQGYLFDPSNVLPGEVTIYCENASAHGCTEGTEQTIEIRSAPSTSFVLSTYCITDFGGMISFENLTPDKLMVESWSWDFGDPVSGSENSSSNVNPSHFYEAPGTRNIALTATSFDGCSETYEMNADLGLVPKADFTWISNCYNPDSEVSFLDRSEGGSSLLTGFQWTFRNGEGTILDQVLTQNSEDTVGYQFMELDHYRVDLIAETELGCKDSVSKEILLQPTILVTDEGYSEGFNHGDGMWKIMSEDSVYSWVLSEPDFTGFDTISGDKAWITQFPSGVIGYRENSWVQSPCFDFSEAERSMIQMNIMRSFVPSLNGAVLQYRDIVEEGWKNVGELSSGVNWYNVPALINKPGGSDAGWGLEVFNPDKAWVRVAHPLDQMDGQTNISFRIAIASTGAQGIGNQGFAFDNIFIGERTKVSVLEHFTNSSVEISGQADDLVDSISLEHQRDIIDLQYHTSYPGDDPMNANNPIPAETRSYYYGIQEVPYAVLDGGISDEFRYPFTDLKATPMMEYVDLAPLEVPQFRVNLFVDWMENGFESTVKVTCLTESYSNNIQLYIVVFEREVTVYEGTYGDTVFRNVVLDMLPTASGSLLGGDWENGDSDSRTEEWDYTFYVEDIRDLGVAAFIQDRSTGKILQADVNLRRWDVGVEAYKEIPDLHVYPNPAKNEVYVNLGRIAERAGLLRVMDMNGRQVMTEQIPAGYQVYQLNINQLNRGLYLLYWMEGDQVRGITKIIKTE
jgi:PKD repeat protein